MNRLAVSRGLAYVFGVLTPLAETCRRWGAWWGLRHHNTTVNPYGKASRAVTTGPFRYSRNPIYFGLLLVVLGFGVGLNSAWLVAATVALLMAEFGDEYREYTKRVRRWL